MGGGRDISSNGNFPLRPSSSPWSHAGGAHHSAANAVGERNLLRKTTKNQTCHFCKRLTFNNLFQHHIFLAQTKHTGTICLISFCPQTWRPAKPTHGKPHLQPNHSALTGCLANRQASHIRTRYGESPIPLEKARAAKKQTKRRGRARFASAIFIGGDTAALYSRTLGNVRSFSTVQQSLITVHQSPTN